MNFSGNKDGPGPPKLQLVAFGKLERSLSIKLTSARLRQALFLCGETRAAGTATRKSDGLVCPSFRHKRSAADLAASPSILGQRFERSCDGRQTHAEIGRECANCGQSVARF